MIDSRIEYTPLVEGFRFTKISHRIGLATGLYNVKLNEVLPKDVPFIGEIPIIYYANKLYLVSKQGQTIQSNIGSMEYTPSVIASIDHIIGKDIPIRQNLETDCKPIKNIVNIDSFKQIELEVKPVYPPKMKLT